MLFSKPPPSRRYNIVHELARRKAQEALDRAYSTAVELIQLAAYDGKVSVNLPWLPDAVLLKLDNEGFMIEKKSSWMEPGSCTITIKWDRHPRPNMRLS
jgi:hypothetical protein